MEMSMPPQVEEQLMRYIGDLHEERFVNRVLLQWLIGNFILYILVSLLAKRTDPTWFSAGYMALSALVLWLGPVRRHYKQPAVNPFIDKGPYLESPIRFVVTLVGLSALFAVIGAVLSIVFIQFGLPLLDPFVDDDYHRLAIEGFRRGDGIMAAVAAGMAVYLAKILR
jgi:hypothetical protein